MDVINRILDKHDDKTYTWHLNCYKNFTHVGKIKRLENALQKENELSNLCINEPQIEVGSRNLRSSVSYFDYKKCMFCQLLSKKEILYNVAMDSMNSFMKDHYTYDCKLRIALANCYDLFADELKYHLKCYTAFNAR